MMIITETFIISAQMLLQKNGFKILRSLEIG